MGLTTNQQFLIMAVAKNDIQTARKRALDCVKEDTTQKNKYFCDKYKKILESSDSSVLSE